LTLQPVEARDSRPRVTDLARGFVLLPARVSTSPSSDECGAPPARALAAVIVKRAAAGCGSRTPGALEAVRAFVASPG
jgi:hypothetical protein